MVQGPQVAEAPTVQVGVDSILQRATPCDATALQRLKAAFGSSQAMAVLIGKGRARPGRVVADFVAATAGDAEIVHFAQPFADATSFMREIVRLIGFEPKDLSLADLDNILKMFLAYQKTHGRRTVICIENAQECSSWVLDKICDLVAMEVEESFGSFFVLSGRPALSTLLREDPLNKVSAQAGRRIPVAPLKPSETREFVRLCIESEGIDDLSLAIDYEAIAELHRIGEGIPDVIYDLCARSLATAIERSVLPITAALIVEVDGARGKGRLVATPPAADSGKGARILRSPDRLVVRLDGNPPRTYAINTDSVSVGRDPGNDVYISSLLVSRSHALLVSSAAGAKLIDLGSTNGTFVNGCEIESRVLQHGDQIKIGDCRIEFLSSAPKQETSASDGATAVNPAVPAIESGVAQSSGAP